MAPTRPLKIAVLGGGGMRVPLLARALAGSGLDLDELALFDRNPGRLAGMARAARAAAPDLPLRETKAAADAVRGSRFVIAAIREGGQEARAHDERVCLEAGVLGQETVGAAGAALAMRNIPAMLRLARVVEEEAPEATLINYTNPAGMVTEAIRSETALEAIGICDTPAELAERVAGLLYLAPGSWSPGWSGINHLGWLTALYQTASGPDAPLPPENRLADLFRDPDRLMRVHPAPLFEPVEMAGAVPSEYVFLHAHPERAVERARRAGTTRGAVVVGLEEELFAALEAARESPEAALAAYRTVMDARDASYFGIESRGEAMAPAAASRERASGYDRIGLEVIRARVGPSPAEIVVNTRNRTPPGGPAVPELPAEDTVETVARVGPEGVFPIPQPPLPAAAGALLRRVKSAEREFVQAALIGDPRIAAEALREHPAGGPEAAGVFGRLRR